MRDVFELESQTEIDQTSSYIVSYPHLVSYFADLEEIKVADLVRGAHMVYAWMPRILNLHVLDDKSLANVAALLTKAKREGDLTNPEIEEIAAVIDRSLVGGSKLLHFIVPQHFAIWDSRVYQFIHGKVAHSYRVNNVALYRDYLNLLHDIEKRDGFAPFHRAMNEKLGYPVFSFRAIELVMYEWGKATR